jgi:hypothetical protein
LRYQRGSKDLGIEKRSYAEVVATQPQDNLVTVQKSDGAQVTYDPFRLHGISAYREIERAFAMGDRLAFTAPNRELGIANRDLGTIEQIGNNKLLAVRMDSGKAISFDANEMRHFDHGYAVTSHGSQGLTAERVLVNIDSSVHLELIKRRVALVTGGSRGIGKTISLVLVAALNGSDRHDFAVSQGLDIADWGPAKESPVLAIELARAFVPDLERRTRMHSARV